MVFSLSLKLAISVVLLLIVLISGRILYKTGEPYSQIIFTVHKLTTIGLIVLMANVNKIQPLSAIMLLIISIAVLLLFIILVTGGILGAGKQKVGLPFIHMLSSVGFTVLIAAVLWMLF